MSSIFFSAAFAASVAANSCDKCVSSGAEWCPITDTCHTRSWFSNSACNSAESIEGEREAKFCDCNCVLPPANTTKAVCSWYTDKTGSSDPMEWKGGDFLPYNYRTAAHCACSGCSERGVCNELWEKNLPVTSCVRASLLQQHKALPADFRQKVKETGYVRSYEIVDVFYKMHVKAYAGCCCTAPPAPYATWLGVFYGGGFLPCSAITASILTFGRCGCGW